ncbi:MAG: hypothetical protein RL385_2577 [Pseudomonadota bacterium]|jgi:hypothetical protein
MRPSSRTLAALLATLATAGTSSLALATPPMLPPAMLLACKGRPEGAPCQFEMSGKQIEGACSPLPNAELACRPGAAKPPAKQKPGAAH